jgi:hypothetical protein
MYFTYCICKIKPNFNFHFIYTGLAVSESFNVVLFYICNMQNAYNPKSNNNV